MVGLFALTALGCRAGGSGGEAASPPAAGTSTVTAGTTAGSTTTASTGGTDGGTGGGTPTPPPAPAVGAAVRLLGRFTTQDVSAGPIMAWPASRVILGFDGTRLAVTLTEPDYAGYAGVDVNNVFSASVDGGPTTLYALQHGDNPLTLARNLTAGHHVVVLSKRTESQIGRTQLGAVVTDGTLTSTPPPSARRLQVLGDSGPAGFGTDGVSPCAFSPATENADASFPLVAGTLLGADVHNLSFSGKGVFQNRDPRADPDKTLAVLWDRTLPSDETVWDHSLWMPQAVVVITGGNDYYAGIPDRSRFIQVVGAFLRKVRATYPDAHVWFAASPLDFDQHDTAVAYVTATVQAVGDPKVHVMALPLDDGSRGRGCSGHLLPATHTIIGQAMATTIKAQLGW